MRTTTVSFLVLVLTAPLSARADVWVVDASGAGDFSELQPAIDAASDGDVLRVRTGSYGPALIEAKGLVVGAEPGDVVEVVGGIRVRETAPDQPVTLLGLRARGTNDGAPAIREALSLDDTAGPVRAFDCSWSGADGIYYGLPDNGARAAFLFLANDAVFADCAFVGGDGASSTNAFGTNRGGEGLFALLSNVALYDCGAAGGPGGEGDFEGCDLGGRGGHGIESFDSFLFASGGRAQGGAGGGDDFASCEPGGHGLFLRGSDGDTHLLDVELGGGAGACWAPPGQDLATEGGASSTTIRGVAVGLSGAGLTEDEASVPVSFAGAEGELVLLMVSTTPALLPAALFDGVLTIALPLAIAPLSMGTIGAGGQLAGALDVPSLPPGTAALTLHLQTVHVSSTARIGAPGALTILAN